MQGRKEFRPKLFYELSLERLVPADNIYRKIGEELDFQFLYDSTKKYYGTEGQQSLDPVVFYKILLVGYLNNLNSDRALLQYCGNCLDIRLFYLKKLLKFKVKKVKTQAQILNLPKGKIGAIA